MSWDSFVWFALTAVLLWTAGAFFAWKERKPLVYACTLTGIALFFAFILGMWISLERPPLRTMGETRLWYSFFLPVAGIIVYSRWRYKWILSFSTLLSFVFICVNLLKPGIHSKSLMPALQSPWFAPHVIVYMFSYALLGAATVMAVYMLIRKGKTTEKEINLTDNLVYVGLAFLT
ncbi:MAG: cytochrome c biogenesis protein CcsA, partial [Bacteroidales bacterium]|nr:cytochrome c biogenesis protein CcsA [Bacteroidales bacterium]